MRLMRALAVVVVFGWLGGGAPRAQDAAPPDALDTARELAAVLAAATIDDLSAKFAGEAWPQQEADLRAKFPTIDDATVAALRGDFERLQFVAIVEGLEEAAAVYARYLSVDDMRAMIAFYSTPAGVRALTALPAALAQSMAALAPRLATVQQSFAAALAPATPDAVRQILDAERRQQEAARRMARLAGREDDPAAQAARQKRLLEEAARRRRAAIEQFTTQLKAAREQLKAKAAAAAEAKAEAARAKAEAAAKKEAKAEANSEPAVESPP